MKLYPYQQDAVDAIVASHRVLLAYEMGLGKTAISISACERLMKGEVIRHPVLVVVPSSLRYQWGAELKKWAPDSAVLLVDGSPTDRDVLYARMEYEFVDYVITTYDLILRDYSWYQRRPWGAIILDEATAIKSFRAKRAKAIKVLSEKVGVRLALTGTPIVNGKAEEAFSIMEFVDPKVLGGWWSFDKRYIRRHPSGWITRYVNIPELNDKLSSSMLRKRQLDDDVKGYLPEVLHMDPILVDMDSRMRIIYDIIADDCISALDDAINLYGPTFDLAYHYGRSDSKKFDPEMEQVRGRIMQSYQALRMLCDHPSMLIDSANDFFASNGESGSSYCWNLLVRKLLRHQGSVPPKAAALQAYIRDAIEADPDVKIAVYSQFTRVFPYLHDLLRSFGIVQFNGGMSAKKKNEALHRFKTDPDIHVLLSSDAGGVGVDLPEASILINYNVPWGSGTQLQRNSRIVRASSDHKQVRIEYLMTRGTVEERIFDTVQHKMSVARGIIDGEVERADGDIVSSADSLREFLVSRG